MIIDPALALRFINTYKDFLGTLLSKQEQRGKSLTQCLVEGRDHYMADQATLTHYRKKHPQADTEMLDAIAALRVERWIYLKDTRYYSVWLDEQGQAAYAVHGLTDRLRVVTQGYTGVTIVAGLISLQGRWVSDGLLQDVVLLSPNYMREYTAIYRGLREQKRLSLGAARELP